MRRSATALVMLGLLSGCGAGWHQEPATPQTAIPARKQVLVYHGGATERWHAVRIGADSITGIHWLRPIEADTGRLALPLAGVDSIRVGDPGGGFVRGSLLTTYVVLPVTLVVLCLALHGCPSD